MTGVQMVPIRKVGTGSGVTCGHVVHRNLNGRLPERWRVRGMHSPGPHGSLVRRNGHVVHT
jgi:hypothetical protein